MANDSSRSWSQGTPATSASRPAITVLTLAGLILWRRRGWKTWPIALGGVLLTILAAFIAYQVVGLAYGN
jgi:hypothetical protein